MSEIEVKLDEELEFVELTDANGNTCSIWIGDFDIVARDWTQQRPGTMLFAEGIKIKAKKSKKKC